MELRRLFGDVSSEAVLALRANWSWLVPNDYRPLYATAFGDIFLEASNGTVFFLDSLSGRLSDAADNEGQLEEQLCQPALQEEVFMSALAANLAKHLGPLQPGHCYSVIVPPSVGGTLEPANFHQLPLPAHLSALGSMQHQVANDPVGTVYRSVRSGA